jgi:hypothetical protein
MGPSDLAADPGSSDGRLDALALRRRSREVLAMVGSAGYGAAPGGAIDFARASRSPIRAAQPEVVEELQTARLLCAADSSPDPST